MKFRALDLLCCPLCKSALELKVSDKKEDETGVILQEIPCAFFCGRKKLYLNSGNITINECQECY